MTGRDVTIGDIISSVGGWWCVCVCVLGGPVRRGCAYFRFRVHYEYISGIMSFGFSTLRCYPRVRHTVAAGCGISRRVHFFGAMQITWELCFGEGATMVTFRGVNICCCVAC